MWTPPIASEIWKADGATCLPQPPFWIRFAALLNDAQNCGRSFVEVAGGDTAAGNWSAIAGLFVPGSVKLAGVVAFTAPVRRLPGLPHPFAHAFRINDASANHATPAAAPPR